MASGIHRRLVDAGDAFAVDHLERHGGVEGEAREDRGLLRGVVALDIGGGVGLGVAEALRVGEHVGELGTLFVHAVEDVVGRAVDDAHDPLHAVAGERVAQRADDRDGACRGRLVVHLGAHLVGGVEELGTVGREQRLVRRHDVGARVDRLQQVLPRRLDASHELDHDVGADDERLGIRREELARQVDVAGRIDVADGDPDELESGSGAVGELVAVLAQQRCDLRAHGSGAEERDAQAAVVGHFDRLPSGSGEARVAGEQVIDRLAAHDDARLSPAHRDDRRAGDVVVVARE